MTDNVVFVPQNPGQREITRIWDDARLIFLIGPAGTGKTLAALYHGVRDLSNGHRLWLTRPMVDCDESMGYFPGDVKEKMMPWLAPFLDAWQAISNVKWENIENGNLIDYPPVGLLSGRTITKGTLLVDECHNLTGRQIKRIATRVGRRGRIVLMGDPTQYDRRVESCSPLERYAGLLEDVNGVHIIRFTEDDVVRDPFVADVLRALDGISD